MISRAWRLPWRGKWVPHALLDVIRGCNLTCRACYNTSSPAIKGLAELRKEFAILRQERVMDSLAIVGGEPTLHPHLLDIVRMIKSAGVSVEIFTNGALLDDVMLRDLKSAGTDLIFLHIDAHQRRRDLSDSTPEALQRLRSQKAASIASAGIEVGLAITAYDDAPQEIDAAVEFVLASPHVDYLLVTLCREMQEMGTLTGDLSAGICGRATGAPSLRVADRLDNSKVYYRLRERFSLEPFAYIGSNVDASDPRWLSYMIGTLFKDGGCISRSMLRPSLAERGFVAVHRWLRGRYPFFIKHSSRRFRVQLLLNGLTGGAMGANLRLIGRSLAPGRVLRAKRLLIQCPAEIGDDGKLIHCENCPDATVRHGKLVPICITDQVVAPEPREGANACPSARS